MAAQLSLNMDVPPTERMPESIIAQAATDDLAAMISEVVGQIPRIGHAKGTAREKIMRPMAYLYACRDRLPVERRMLVARICAAVTGEPSARIAEIVSGDGRPLWLRLNGESSTGMYSTGRDPWRTMEGLPETGKWAWCLNFAQRSAGSTWRYQTKTAMDNLPPELAGTLEGILLALRWSPALAHVVRWRRDGHALGDDMLARRDIALDMAAAENLHERDHAETFRLASISPLTPLGRAIMAVRPTAER